MLSVITAYLKNKSKLLECHKIINTFFSIQIKITSFIFKQSNIRILKDENYKRKLINYNDISLYISIVYIILIKIWGFIN